MTNVTKERVRNCQSRTSISDEEIISHCSDSESLKSLCCTKHQDDWESGVKGAKLLQNRTLVFCFKAKVEAESQNHWCLVNLARENCVIAPIERIVIVVAHTQPSCGPESWGAMAMVQLKFEGYAIELLLQVPDNSITVPPSSLSYASCCRDSCFCSTLSLE